MRRSAFLAAMLAAVMGFGGGCGEDETAEHDKEHHEQTTGNDSNTTAPGDHSNGEQDAGTLVVPLDSITVTIDATNAEQYAYFSFESGTVLPIADPKNSDEWDMGFKRTEVILNGGVSGPGKAGLVIVDNGDFNAVRQAPADGYVQDSDQDLAFIPESDQGWYHYTGPPLHQILPLERVFVIRTARGRYAKLRVLGYYKDIAAKKDSGFVTVEYAFQSDGTRNF